MKWAGEKLKNAVKNAGMTQQQLADSLGVSRATVVSWMKDQVPKGIELMGICQHLGVTPEYLFENDIIYSFPRHRLVAHAKKTDQIDQASIDLINNYDLFFRDDFSEPLSLSINYHKQANPLAIASELRKVIEINDDNPIKLKNVFDLANRLGIFVIPVSFVGALEKTSAFYTLFNECNKVIFINESVKCLDLIYFLLHEICHAIINSDDVNDEEESFCEATARAMQFPECYVAKVFLAIAGKTNGVAINTLKEFSVRNNHSLYGIAVALDHYYKTNFASIIGGANQNLNKTLPNLRSLLFDGDSIHSFIQRFSSISPRYFEKIILKEYANVSDRKLCELLSLEDITNINEIREELKRYENANQAGCSY
jgi:transcriptional regulator with XRE-family HTH domain